MKRILTILALLVVTLNAFNFESKQRVNEVVAFMQLLVNDVSYDAATKKLTVMKHDGDSYQLDLSSLYSGDINGLVKGVELDNTNRRLVVLKYDGTEDLVNISELYANVNVVSGTLNDSSKRIELTLNDISSSKVFIDMSSIYDAFNMLHARQIYSFSYVNDLLRITANDGSTHEAIIPTATPYKKGLMDKSDKELLDNLGRTKVISYFVPDELDTHLIEKKVGGVDSDMRLSHSSVSGVITNDGDREMLTVGYLFKLQNIDSSIKFPSNGAFNVVVDIGTMLKTRAAVGTVILGERGAGAATASCGDPAKKLPLYNLSVSTTGGNLAFYASSASHIYNAMENGTPGISGGGPGLPPGINDAYVPVEHCTVRGTLSVEVSRP